MSDALAWSHSRMKMFLTCPKQLWHNAVAPKGHPDKIAFVQSKAMLDGLEVDDALTARVAKGTPLPSKFAPYEPMAAMICAAPGQKFTQLRVTLDPAFKPCGYFDATAWVRAVYDAAIINGEHAFIFDYKNGQVWLDESQLALFAAVGFHQFPELETIQTSYIWLRHGITSDKTYHRRELSDIWQVFLPDVERMQVCYRTNTWPAAPSRGAKSCARCEVNRMNLCKEAQGPHG